MLSYVTFYNVYYAAYCDLYLFNHNLFKLSSTDRYLFCFSLNKIQI